MKIISDKTASTTTHTRHIKIDTVPVDIPAWLGDLLADLFTRAEKVS